MSQINYENKLKQHWKESDNFSLYTRNSIDLKSLENRIFMQNKK